jgi:hypothetical protein
VGDSSGSGIHLDASGPSQPGGVLATRVFTLVSGWPSRLRP